MNEGRYRLIGSTASPYAIKLRALMRYRRIPFDWVIMTKALRKQTAHLRPNLIPVLQYPDGSFRGETTTLGLRSGSPASGPLRHSRRQGGRLRLRSPGRPRRRMGGETAVLLPLVGSRRSGLCLALGRAKNGQPRTRRPAAPRKSSNSAAGRFPACPFSAPRLKTSRCWKKATIGFWRRSSLTSA